MVKEFFKNQNFKFKNKKSNFKNLNKMNSTNFKQCFNQILNNENSNINLNSYHSNETSANKQLADKLFFTRKKLPIFSVKNQLIKAIQENETIIIIGETGSGKTTQVPQFILKSIPNCSICITQPRRVAAISLAIRVSQEIGTDIGYLVGYSVRFEEKFCNKTKIKFVTDGMLLREILNDENLSKYNFIILDEAHERSIQTDVLFTLLKSIQEKRKKTDNCLKLIIMSATMNVDKFSTYFKKAPVYYLEGRLHPVKIYNSIKEQTDYQYSAIITVFQIHKNEPDGDILVFCTGQEEIESMIRLTQQNSLDLNHDSKKIIALPLYSALPTSLQMKVFKVTEPNSRKVIFATNIAETSITIPGIKYVIDTGKVKIRTFKVSTGIEFLQIENISKSQAKQRTGRAGRESSGVCYRLYTEEEQEKFSEFTLPEIVRTSLESILLQLSALNIKNYADFDFMDKPNIENIKKSAFILQRLGAIKNTEENQYELTDLGKQMSIFPLNPKLSKILIESSKLECTEEILTIISLLYVDNIFYIPVHKRENAFKTIDKFTSSEGDHITLLNVYKAYKSVNGNKSWCSENYINIRNMETALNVRKQLSAFCENAKLMKKSVRDDNEKIRKCLTYGLLTNVAYLHKEGYYQVEQTNEKVYIHPTSCLHKLKPEVLIFTELVKTTKCYIRQLSIIDKRWLNK